MDELGGECRGQTRRLLARRDPALDPRADPVDDEGEHRHAGGDAEPQPHLDAQQHPHRHQQPGAAGDDVHDHPHDLRGRLGVGDEDVGQVTRPPPGAGAGIGEDPAGDADPKLMGLGDRDRGHLPERGAAACGEHCEQCQDGEYGQHDRGRWAAVDGVVDGEADGEGHQRLADLVAGGRRAGERERACVAAQDAGEQRLHTPER
ncbi:hypothetical protein OHA72_45490 [Dactylosporangium sp. NBC_01737]|nr:hypothetical protein OHA72_45490 [Dactylosporangium sp. NBC_01737]